MKKICVVTGSRSEYGLLRPVMRAIGRSESLRLQLVVTGMHTEVDERFGATIREVEADGFGIDERFPMSPEGDSTADMGKAVGRGIVSFIDAFGRLDPDVVFVLGDRVEPFAAGIAAVFSGKCLAHVHGGDRSRGGVDEVMRHAITKLAHVHFAATEESADRIRRMGEREENVHVVGSPGLDEVISGPFTSPDEITKLIGVPMEPPPIVVLQHPVTTRPDDAATEIRTTLEAVTGLDRAVALIMPNNDAGARRMMEVIREYCVRGQIHWVANLARRHFLSLLKCAGVLVGNSSCGMIEAPSFRLPVVNIGERQGGRERAANVVDVASEREAIRGAIRKCLYGKDFRRSLENLENPYGDGHASERIVKVLEDLTIDHNLIQKQIAY